MPTGSSPAGASGNPATSGPRASAYQPANQPGADAILQSIAAAFQQGGGTNPGATPGGWAYPYAQSAIQSVVDPQNPYLQQAINAGSTAFNAYQPFLNLNPQLDLSYQYGSSLPGMLSAAENIAGYAPGLAANAGQLLGLTGYDAGLLQQSMPGNAAALGTSAGQILNTAFDPQNALFNQMSQQVQNQARAANAAAGLGGTAYGAGQEGNTLSNFDINWQNQQLGRQAQGLQAAGGAYAQIPGLIGAPVNLLSAGTSGAINPLAAAANLTTSPGQAFSAITNPLFQQAQGVSGMLSPYVSYAGMPYNTLNTGVSNILGNLGQGVNIGNQQFTIPQQLANDLQSYLGLGQSASQLSGQLGAMGQQQLFNSLSGLGGAASLGSNLLFGNSNPLSSSGGLLGLAGLNPLFSSAGAGGGLDLAGATGGLFGAAGTGFDALGGAAAAGGGIGDIFSALGPLGALAAF